MSENRITYRARPDATPETEQKILASVYSFVLRTHQEKQKTSCPSPIEGAERNPDEPGAVPKNHDG